MIRGFAILLMLQFAGEALGRWLDLPIPGNVIGMGLLLGALSAGVLKVEWVEEAADLLLSNLALFFIPAGAGIMVHFDLLQREWLPILVPSFLSTFAVMAVTGWSEKWLERRHGVSHEEGRNGA